MYNGLRVAYIENQRYTHGCVPEDDHFSTLSTDSSRGTAPAVASGFALLPLDGFGQATYFLTGVRGPPYVPSVFED